MKKFWKHFEAGRVFFLPWAENTHTHIIIQFCHEPASRLMTIAILP
jgi:hypothetical protein